MANVLLTQQGLNFITSANNNGPLVAIKYFLPVYDDRIDSGVRPTPLVSSFSQIADKNAIEPYGEKLWKDQGPYFVDNSNKYIISASTFNGTVLQNSYQRNLSYTNLKNNGSPVSYQVCASSWSPSATSNNRTNWNCTTGTGVTATSNSDLSPNGNSRLIRVDGYYPAYGNDNNNLVGSFKCTLKNQNIGSIKFNKVALYAVQINSNGIETGNKCFFGEAYLSGAAPVVSNTGLGYDSFEFDVQVSISGVSANWSNIFYSTSGDYWSKSPGGLYYPNRIGIGNFNDSVNEIAATVHARKSRNTSGAVDDTIPIIRLDYNDNKFIEIDLPGTTYESMIGTSVTYINSGSDIIINPFHNAGYSGSEYYGKAIAIKPKFGGSIVLGTLYNPFRELYLENKAGYYSTPSFRSDVICLNIKNTNNYGAQINNNVFLGTSAYGEKFGIRLDNIGIEIIENATSYGAFKGGDLWRKSEDLLIYNTSSTPNPIYKNINIFAGLNDSSLTHNQLVGRTDGSFPPMFSRNSQDLNNYSQVSIAAKGGIALFGPVVVTNIHDRAEGYESYPDNAFLLSKQSDTNFVIGAGLTPTQLNNYAVIMANDKFSFRNAGLDITTNMYLVAGNIFVDSNITPLANNTYNIGTSANRFADINTNRIKIGDLTANNGDGQGLMLGTIGDQESGVTHGLVTLGNGTTTRVLAQLGQRSDHIYWGFFDNLVSNNLFVGNSNSIPINENIGSLQVPFNEGYFNNIYIGNNKIGGWNTLPTKLVLGRNDSENANGLNFRFLDSNGRELDSTDITIETILQTNNNPYFTKVSKISNLIILNGLFQLKFNNSKTFRMIQMWFGSNIYNTYKVKYDTDLWGPNTLGSLMTGFTELYPIVNGRLNSDDKAIILKTFTQNENVYLSNNQQRKDCFICHQLRYNDIITVTYDNTQSANVRFAFNLIYEHG